MTDEFEREYVEEQIRKGRRGEPIRLKPGDQFHLLFAGDGTNRVMIVKGVAACSLGPCPPTYEFVGNGGGFVAERRQNED